MIEKLRGLLYETIITYATNNNKIWDSFKNIDKKYQDIYHQSVLKELELYFIDYSNLIQESPSAKRETITVSH